MHLTGKGPTSTGETDSADLRDRRITRLGGLKYATGLFFETALEVEEKADRALDIARKFERYVLYEGLDEIIPPQ